MLFALTAQHRRFLMSVCINFTSAALCFQVVPRWCDLKYWIMLRKKRTLSLSATTVASFCDCRYGIITRPCASLSLIRIMPLQSSCHETSAAVVKWNYHVRSSGSKIDLHVTGKADYAFHVYTVNVKVQPPLALSSISHFCLASSVVHSQYVCQSVPSVAKAA